MPLAEYNRGRLRHDWDDRRVAEFVNNIERVNAVAERSDGFIWRLDNRRMEIAQTDRNFGGHPRLASTLSVWRDLAALEAFVFQTVHARFYDRGGEWFEPSEPKMVLWDVPEGHMPTVGEAWERFRELEAHGDSPRAFGWDYARRVNVGKTVTD